ncbi:DUF2914 domain-containing protein [bacterium]|nr:DUF2914 domain-containing protein [bacterium]
MEQFYKKTKAKMHKVKRHWLTVAFFLGFVLDNITLNRVDQVFDNIVLFFYVILVMVSLLIMYASAAEKLPGRLQVYGRKYAQLLVQFAMGGLLSGMLIFYGRSGSWLESWPFLLIILAVIYSNETIKNRSQRLVFNIAMLFIGLFSYVVLVVPVFTGKMGAWVFVGSGFVALLIMILFIKTLRRIVPHFIQLHLRAVAFTVGAIYISLNFFYFSNMIPPIPLSLKDVGIYHSVVHFDDGSYRLTYEKPEWYVFWRKSDTTFHFEPGDNIFCFASVFAPTRLATDIYHKWERYNEELGQWDEYGRFSYAIEGGRGSGFRGYTLIKNYSIGTWRCTVETERGQVIGREEFTVSSEPRGELVTRTE